MKSFKKTLTICILLCIFCIAGIAGAQSLETIKSIKLDTTKLTLAAGNNYTFYPQFTVENPRGIYNQKLLLFSTNENVVQVSDNEVNTITAVGKGTAKIYAYAEGYTASAVCTVTVTGNASNDVSPVAWTKPDSKLLGKVQDPALKAFFTMLGKSDMKTNAGRLAQNTWFKTIITLSPNADLETVINRIDSINNTDDPEKMVLKNWHHLYRINSLAIQGTAAGYQELLKEPFVLSVKADPISLTMGNTGEEMLEGMSESLSHFSEAEWMTGEGSYIVILDTGVEDGHEQLEGKVFDQACFSSFVEGGDTYPVCRGENTQFNDSDSYADEAALENSHVFNHGTFVAAIAAGKNGVAKGAEIISLNVFSAKVFTILRSDREGNQWYEEWHTAASYASDQMRALEFFLDKYDENPIPVAAVNMSFGNGKETKACTADIRESYFEMLLSRGIIPVTASGSNGWDGAVSNPACSPSTFTVGALWDSAEPEVAGFSNHSPLVNIMAPGTFILSATNEEENGYRNWDGTSFAAPMVSGAIARLRQVFPNAVLDPQDQNRMTAVQLESLMSGIAVRSAERKKVSVPVLDFNALDAFLESMFNPYKYQGVYGGTKQLRLNYKKLSFANTYTIEVFPANNDGSVSNTNPVVSLSGKNLPENVIVKNLNNGKLYSIRTKIELSLNSKADPFIIENRHFGMPMDPLPAGECEIKLIQPATDEEDPQFEFKWNNNNKGNYEHWVMWASAVDDHIDIAEHDNNWTNHAMWDRPISADFHRIRNMNLKDGDGGNYVETLFSEGTAIDAFPLRKPMWAQWRVRNGRCWLGYDEMPPMLTAREVVIEQLKVDANGDVIRDNAGKPTVEKNLKTLKADAKKFPYDIVITGLPDNVPMQIRVRTLAAYNKKTYASDWWTVGYEDGEGFYHDDQWSWTPVYSKEEEEYPGFDGLFSGVSIITGDKTATVNYDKDFTVDGMRFEIKPIEPNHKKFVQEALIAKNPTSYTIPNLNNGWVYKLRLQQTVKAGKGSVRSTYFPGKWIEMGNDEGDTWLAADYEARPEDTAWLGITFVPLPAPQADYRSDAYDNNTRRELRIIVDNAADGFALVEIGNGTDAYVERFRWWEGQPDGEAYYFSGEETRWLDPAGPNRTHVVMLWKEWDGIVYYGPAVYMDLVNQWPGEQDYPDYITTGPKSPDMIDLFSIPELSDAAQIDGQVSLSYYDSVAKGIDEYPEIRLLDINELTEEDITVEPETNAGYSDALEVYAEEETAAEQTVDEADPTPVEKSKPVIPGSPDYSGLELFYIGY